MTETNTDLKIALADDHHVFREGIKILLESVDGFQIVAETSDCQGLLALIDNSNIDILMCDYLMPGGDTLSCLVKLKIAQPDLKILVLTGVSAGALYQKLQALPVNGILSKESSIKEILSALKDVSTGKQVFSAQVQAQLDSLANNLTKRELEVVEYTAKGLSNSDIANKLYISTKTAENHRTNIYRKLNVKNAIELANSARKAGLII